MVKYTINRGNLLVIEKDDEGPIGMYCPKRSGESLKQCSITCPMFGLGKSQSVRNRPQTYKVFLYCCNRQVETITPVPEGEL